MKKIIIYILAASLSCKAENYFKKIESYLRLPITILSNLGNKKEKAWARETPCIKIIGQTEKVCDAITKEYEFEIKYLLNKLYALSDGDMQTVEGEQKKFLDYLEKLPTLKGRDIDYYENICNAIAKLKRFRTYLDEVEHIAKLQLKTKEYEKEAEILDQKPDLLRDEYRFSIARAPELKNTIDQLQEFLGVIEREITPIATSPRNIFYKDKQLNNIKIHTFSPSLSRILRFTTQYQDPANKETRRPVNNNFFITKLLKLFGSCNPNQDPEDYKKHEKLRRSLDDMPFISWGKEENKRKNILKMYSKALRDLEVEARYINNLILEDRKNCRKPGNQNAQQNNDNFDPTLITKEELLRVQETLGTKSLESMFEDTSPESIDRLIKENHKKSLQKSAKLHPDKRQAELQGLSDEDREKKWKEINDEFQKALEPDQQFEKFITLFRESPKARKEFDAWANRKRHGITIELTREHYKQNPELIKGLLRGSHFGRYRYPILGLKSVLQRKKKYDAALAGEIELEPPTTMNAFIRNMQRMDAMKKWQDAMKKEQPVPVKTRRPIGLLTWKDSDEPKENIAVHNQETQEKKQTKRERTARRRRNHLNNVRMPQGSKPE